MIGWQKQLQELFPKTREKFKLDYQAAVGASRYWHEGVSTGIVLPITSTLKSGLITWQVPESISGGGKIVDYGFAEKREIIVPPLVRKFDSEKPNKYFAYLISIDPAPGLEKAFRKITDSELTGLLAHELAEITLAMKQPNFHKRIKHHGLPESDVDAIAAQYGYKSQVISYLELLNRNLPTLHKRPEPRSFLDDLVGMGVTVIQMDEPSSARVTAACSKEISERLRALRNL